MFPKKPYIQHFKNERTDSMGPQGDSHRAASTLRDSTEKGFIMRGSKPRKSLLETLVKRNNRDEKRKRRKLKKKREKNLKNLGLKIRRGTLRKR